MDYRELLKKYIHYVNGAEGTTYLTDDRRYTLPKGFITDEEFAELKKLRDECEREDSTIL